ncbi:MAG: hypothetical protein U1E73_08180 [Planctomycetota bacterium]
MSTSRKRRLPRILRNLAIALGALVVFLLLFVAAFIFNPFEGSVRDVRDLVPRGINFFVRKPLLAEDFTDFPAPKFWEELEAAPAFRELESGSIVQGLRKGGLEQALQQARETADQLKRDSKGYVDLLRDLIGTEICIGGYVQDYSQSPARPLAEPWWCCYTRVSWRIKAALGAAGFGFVQEEIGKNGVKLSNDGDLLVAQLPGVRGPIYIKRHLDVLMAANDKTILQQTQRLIDGNRDEEPLGQMSTYTDGAQARIAKWGDDNFIAQPNAVEFVAEPNAFDGFRRFAASWPDRNNKDSMNERVLASFLNLKGWQLVTGGLMFSERALSATGQVVLNSKQHDAFQNSFYDAESRPRGDWLEPFLAMVPESACAAAALRVPVGEFLHAMFGALETSERDLINDGVRRCTFQNQQLVDMTDLIDKLKIAFLPRAGFVFRRNVPDTERDEKGELKVPVTARSPMPQVAWVFWLRPGTDRLLKDLEQMLRSNAGNFAFKPVWHYRVPFGQTVLPDPVTEFCNPQIPATGEMAMIVFSDFFVLSNSGPLIRDILCTRLSRQTGYKSIQNLDEFAQVDRELPDALNGFVWLRGKNLVSVFDDYLAFAKADTELPDMDWQISTRPQVEEEARRAKFPQYASKAAIPPQILQGEFEQLVQQLMRERWRRERSSFTAGDRANMEQMRSLAKLLDVGYMQLELMKNYIRFQAKLLGNLK